MSIIRIGLLIFLLFFSGVSTNGGQTSIGSVQTENDSALIEINNVTDAVIDEITLHSNDTTITDISSYLSISKSSNITIKNIIITSPTLISYNPTFLFAIYDSKDITFYNVTIQDINSDYILEIFHAERSSNVTVVNSIIRNIEAPKLIIFNFLSCSNTTVLGNILNNLTSEIDFFGFNFKHDFKSQINLNSISNISTSAFHFIEFVDNTGTIFNSNEALNVTAIITKPFTVNNNENNLITNNFIMSINENYSADVFDNLNTMLENNTYYSNTTIKMQDYKVSLLNDGLVLYYNESKPIATVLNWQIRELGGDIKLIQNGYARVIERNFTDDNTLSYNVVYHSNSSINFSLSVVSYENNIYTQVITVDLVYYTQIISSSTTVPDNDGTNKSDGRLSVLISSTILVSIGLLYVSRGYIGRQYGKIKQGRVGKFLRDWRDYRNR